MDRGEVMEYGRPRELLLQQGDNNGHLARIVGETCGVMEQRLKQIAEQVHSLLKLIKLKFHFVHVCILCKE